MNIFYLHPDASACAAMHCDKHVVKMILEYAQLLSTAHHVLDEGTDGIDKSLIYKKTHANHPCAVWVRQSGHNYRWLFLLFECLLAEYSLRYGKFHACTRLVSLLRNAPVNIREERHFFPPPKCMPDEYKCEDTVTSYRNYYIGAKAHFAKWKTKPPEWWKE